MDDQINKVVKMTTFLASHPQTLPRSSALVRLRCVETPVSPEPFRLILGRIYEREKKACGGTGANQVELGLINMCSGPKMAPLHDGREIKMMVRSAIRRDK